MKKVFILFFILILLATTSGCFNSVNNKQVKYLDMKQGEYFFSQNQDWYKISDKIVLSDWIGFGKYNDTVQYVVDANAIDGDVQVGDNFDNELLLFEKNLFWKFYYDENYLIVYLYNFENITCKVIDLKTNKVFDYSVDKVEKEFLLSSMKEEILLTNDDINDLQ